MTARIPCCVPFCRRTTRNDGSFTEWICAKHWRLVGRKAKLIKRRAEAAYKTADIECQAIDAEAVADAKAKGIHGIDREFLDRFSAASDRRFRKAKQSNRAWERCKRAAIEAAGGLR